MADPSDKFDEVRRAGRPSSGVVAIQRRRAEQLGRRVRARQRSTVAALPDPHDDTSLPPLILRAAVAYSSGGAGGGGDPGGVCSVGLAGRRSDQIRSGEPDSRRRYGHFRSLLCCGRGCLGAPILALYDPGTHVRSDGGGGAVAVCPAWLQLR